MTLFNFAFKDSIKHAISEHALSVCRLGITWAFDFKGT